MSRIHYSLNSDFSLKKFIMLLSKIASMKKFQSTEASSPPKRTSSMYKTWNFSLFSFWIPIQRPNWIRFYTVSGSGSETLLYKCTNQVLLQYRHRINIKKGNEAIVIIDNLAAFSKYFPNHTFRMLYRSVSVTSNQNSVQSVETPNERKEFSRFSIC